MRLTDGGTHIMNMIQAHEIINLGNIDTLVEGTYNTYSETGYFVGNYEGGIHITMLPSYNSLGEELMDIHCYFDIPYFPNGVETGKIHYFYYNHVEDNFIKDRIYDVFKFIARAYEEPVELWSNLYNTDLSLYDSLSKGKSSKVASYLEGRVERSKYRLECITSTLNSIGGMI